MLKSRNISLHQLDQSMLEELRNWRNDEQVNRFMDFRESIGVEQQERWFESLNERENYFFIIRVNGIAVGLIHLDKFDKLLNTAESGLFLGKAEYRGTGVVLEASLLLLGFAFNKLELNAINAKISRENKSAILYNQLLGFKEKEQLNAPFSLWVLTREDFESNKSRLQALIH